MIQQINNVQHLCKIHTKLTVKSICRSPFCGFYRQLCQKCSQNDQQHKENYHLKLDVVKNRVQFKVKQIENSFLILKKQKQQKSRNNRISLPKEIKQTLEQIRSIINEKINEFQKTLQQRYQNQVNNKLENLENAINKSIDLLRQQLKLIQQDKYSELELKKFFTNFDYWQQQRKYFKSYIDQILNKHVQNFKQSFDQDKLMKLIVSFQSNLKQIFQQSKPLQLSELQKRPHLFCQQNTHLKKYILSQRTYEDFSLKSQLLSKPYPKEHYQWQDCPQSIYYSQMDCFFIFGQGNKQSNTIIKYQEGNQKDNQKIILYANMLVKRAQFALCLIGMEIFVIGGFNDKQGCLSKCQKMVLNQKPKIFYMSSLEQRSACHTVCSYKNKYILKFGGTNIKAGENKSQNTCFGEVKQLYPQIYSIQKQQWRLINYSVQNNKYRLQFGLYPVITIPLQHDSQKIIIFANKALQKRYDSKSSLQKQKQRKRFDIKCLVTRNQIEFKITQSNYKLNPKYFMYPQTFQRVNRSKGKIMVKDMTKTQNNIYLQYLYEDY